MPRLIDADALEDYIDSDESGLLSAREYKHDYISCIDNMPTIDPVKHGKWEEWSGIITVGPEGKYHCSLCGGRAPYCYDAGFHQRLTDWCPGCGAKMDERKE